MNFTITQTYTNFARLQEIEDDAAELVRVVGYDPDAWPTASQETFRHAQAENLLWVAVREDNPAEAAGFALAEHPAPYFHLEELDVHRNYQRMGIGANLVHEVIEEARRRRCEGITLRTFKTTPWSITLYKKLGFRITEKTFPHLATIEAHERAAKLPVEDRCTMYLTL